MTEREPIRLAGYTSLVVGLILVAVIGWASGLDVRAIVLQLATLALSSVGGLEWARGHVWSPVSHMDEVDAARQMRRAE